MDAELRDALLRCETDVDAALQRLSGNAALYEQCLRMFLNDESMADFNHALANNMWDDAFTAAHALKGVAGNMGFVPLYHAAAEVVILIRSGRTEELDPACRRLKHCFEEICNVIRIYCQSPATS